MALRRRKQMPDDLSPEQREARIAELRTKRRARVRMLAIRSGIASTVLLVLLAIALYWLVQTVAGRDVLLNQIIARLPAGSAFTWTRAEGPLAGPLTLYGVDFRYGKIHFTAERVYLDPDLRPLLGKRLRLDALRLTNATLDIPQSDEPFELPTWPELLPQIEMPLAIQADALEINGLRITQSTQPLIDIARARGGLDIANGYFKAEQLAIDSDRGRLHLHGGYEPSDGYATNLVVTAVFPAALGRTPARLGLVARGNRQRMDVGLAGNAPAPVRVTVDVRGEDNPRWRFSGKTEALDLGLLGLAEASMPLAFDLQARGAGGAADLHGRVQQGEFVAVLEPSKIRIADEVLTVEPLAVRVFEGLTTVRGRADFKDAANPVFKFSANARGLRWGGTSTGASDTDAAVIGADADLGFAGQLKDWAAVGTATLVREQQTAKVDFDARGNSDQLLIKKLLASMPSGSLDATGTVGWEPRLRWDLDAKLAGFDPGYFLPDWKGNVSGDLASTGQARESGGYDASLDVPRLGGSLRGRTLDGRGKFALHGDNGEGELALALGNSRVTAKGTVGDALDIDAELQPLHLDDLLPDASGRIAGTLKLTGKRNAPNVQADLSGTSLQWGGYAAETLSVRGRLPWQGSNGELAIRGSAVDAGMRLDTVRVDARGAVENLQFDGDANNTMGSVSLAGAAVKRGANWQGSLDALQLTPSKGSSWRLQQAARFAQQGAAFTLSPACLAASGGGALCAQADWPKQGLQLHADALPLTLVQPWLPPADGRPLILRGAIQLDAFIKPAGKAWLGEVHLSSLDGGLKLGSNARGEIVRYDNFTFDAQFNPQTIKAHLGTGFKGDGYVDATIATGWDAFAPLKGDIYFNNSRLFWLELLSPDLVRPTGDLRGHVGLAGTRGTPALTGDAQLTQFRGELPSLGITLTDGTVNLDAQADGSATINGTLKSVSSTGGTANGGTLAVDGSLDWKVEGAPLQFNVRGKDFLIADTTELHAVASPNLQVSFANNTIQVRGEVVVPEAKIDLEKLDDGVSVSEDVVVLDPVDPERTPGSRLDLDMAITLGEDVQLNGYGLEGKLAGTLNVRSRVGREMIASGRLDVDGRYTAYGQKLRITRGELLWSNTAVSDPRINIRAEREVVSAGVTAGIDVSGRASSPKATIWSNPTMEESAALAYLVLGRSLNTASSDESQKINAASTALTAGAGLLASQLGARIGLDDAGMLESRTLGSSVFGVGKYLSPKLYVSYGVSIVGGGSALTLKYLLRKGFDVEIESSTVETRGSVNWRKEK